MKDIKSLKGAYELKHHFYLKIRLVESSQLTAKRQNKSNQYYVSIISEGHRNGNNIEKVNWGKKP